MLKCECNEKHARLECEPLPNGLTLVRVYEDEQEVTREAVSNMDTPWHGYSYTTYETVTQGGLTLTPGPRWSSRPTMTLLPLPCALSGTS